jgi:hypothetical protein
VGQGGAEIVRDSRVAAWAWIRLASPRNRRHLNPDRHRHLLSKESCLMTRSVATHTHAACTAVALSTLALITACSTAPAMPEAAARKEIAVAVTASNQLIRFNAGQPGRILSKTALTGLQPGERVLDIDFRIAKGQLYALGSTGRLYRVDAATGAAVAMGAPIALSLASGAFGIDFNPTVDRLRVVGERGLNMRLHPETGAMVDGNAALDGVQPDGALAYVAGDVSAGKAPGVVSAAYTYNKTDEKITTNYAIDATAGTLVIQGSMEGATPAVSPNTGQLRTVGPLGAGVFKTAAFDIADVSGAAFAALTPASAEGSRWYQVDLKTGAARLIGTIGGGESIRGAAIEP